VEKREDLRMSEMGAVYSIEIGLVLANTERTEQGDIFIDFTACLPSR
jgi:hypothetical protein